MTLSAASLRDTCARQLERLQSPDLERHQLLDIATTLMLLIGAIDPEAADDVMGHGLGGEQLPGSDGLATTRADLAWVRSQGRTGPLSELGQRTRRAAKELCLQLNLKPAIGENA